MTGTAWEVAEPILRKLMWVSNLRLVSNLSVNIIPLNSKRERDTVSEKYVNMFFPKISVFPVSSEARNTTSAAFLSVFFHFLAGSRPEHSRAEMNHNNKNWAPSRKPVKGIQTVPASSPATMIRGELVCVTSVRMLGKVTAEKRSLFFMLLRSFVIGAMGFAGFYI